MIDNFTPQPSRLWASTADKRQWLVLGWTIEDGVLRAVASPLGKSTTAHGAPRAIDATAFTQPVSTCGCTGA